MSFWPSRKRVPSEIVVGGMTRIGEFGYGSPLDGDLQETIVQQPGLYHFHEGDLFTPGAGNYVFESPFETPIQPIWGSGANGGMQFPNQPPAPTQPPQVFSNPTITTKGVGGLIPGGIVFQPLADEDGADAGNQV